MQGVLLMLATTRPKVWIEDALRRIVVVDVRVVSSACTRALSLIVKPAKLCLNLSSEDDMVLILSEDVKMLFWTSGLARMGQ